MASMMYIVDVALNAMDLTPSLLLTTYRLLAVLSNRREECNSICDAVSRAAKCAWLIGMMCCMDHTSLSRTGTDSTTHSVIIPNLANLNRGSS